MMKTNKPECLDCKNCYIDNMYHEPACRLKNHYCSEDKDGVYIGQVVMANNRVKDCEDFKLGVIE